jgi:hypothetical protein
MVSVPRSASSSGNGWAFGEIVFMDRYEDWRRIVLTFGMQVIQRVDKGVEEVIEKEVHAMTGGA